MLSAALHASLSTSFSMLFVGLATLTMSFYVLLTMSLSETTSLTNSYRVNITDYLLHRLPHVPQISGRYLFIYERQGRTS